MSEAPGLQRYRDLCQRVDEKFAEIRSSRPTSFACKAACHSCCKPGITVNRMEKEALAHFLGSRPELVESLRSLEKADPFGGKRCRLLGADGLCQVYEARPIVCRSHGAPLQFQPEGKENENVRVRDVCPLNFVGEDLRALPPQTVLNLDTVNTLLALASRLAFPKEEERFELRVDVLLGPA